MKLLQIIIISITITLYACKGDEKKSEINPVNGNTTGQSKPMTVDGIIAKTTFTTGSINTSGSIMSNEEVEIKSEVSGKITGIFFKEGQAVSKGQLLVKLNDDDLQAQVKRAEIEIKLAEEKEKRQKQLLASTAISKEEYDITLTNLNLLKANVDIIKTDIAKTRITAPFSGVAGLKYVSPGAFITSSTIIATVQSTQPLKLEFTVPEKYNQLLKNGSTVSFNIAGTNENFKATIYAKEPKIDPTTRTAKIRATFPNPSGKIAPGSFADITIPIGDKSKAIMIPTMAYIPDINGAKVFVSKGGTAMSVTVKAGIRTEDAIQILEGINEGDTVLTTGILQLKPKTPVNVNIVNKAE
jgi:membrane fusion protein (multidrug efflux system)